MKPFLQFLTDLSALGGLPVYGVLTLFALLTDTALATRLVIAFVVAVGISALIRIVYFKQRPQRRQFRNVIERIDASSFSSLHTMRATILAVLLSQSQLMLSVFLVVAGGVAFARFKLKQHDAADVMCGYIIGFVVAMLVRYFV